MVKRVISDREKDMSECKKGQIIALYQGQKFCKERAEITSIGLRTVQRIIKCCEDVNKPTSSWKTCGRGTILKNCERRSLKILVKSNRQKSTLELTDSFNKRIKTISTRMMKQELIRMSYQ
ncbi:hypothetical protein AVEN_102600-1 [Araneus ventricosus]|uniref:Transposase Tc1-like domain-containing protein n=1 Tax=Araneus ventricosus TaxID=182803 RepID=A0A4Y2BIG2_ARAVE|nr:hypothetical protein AVEN_102600-1 [Araneus ventricosus]